MMVLAQNGTTLVNMDYVARVDIVYKGGSIYELKPLIVDAPDAILCSGFADKVKMAFSRLCEAIDNDDHYFNFRVVAKILDMVPED